MQILIAQTPVNKSAGRQNAWKLTYAKEISIQNQKYVMLNVKRNVEAMSIAEVNVIPIAAITVKNDAVNVKILAELPVMILVAETAAKQIAGIIATPTAQKITSLHQIPLQTHIRITRTILISVVLPRTQINMTTRLHWDLKIP